MLSSLCEVEMKQQHSNRSDLLVPPVQDPIILLDLKQKNTVCWFEPVLKTVWAHSVSL